MHSLVLSRHTVGVFLPNLTLPALRCQSYFHADSTFNVGGVDEC